MSTSLAEQLQRLRAPQTSLFVESKKRASILFDPKDAATKSKKVIFDIGHSGLMELVAINPAFLQFEQTLFDKNAIELERAVESPEINQILDENIKKFFYHLSPFFMLEPAHKCLEWLIRRFHIHEFNKKYFVALILPYHETMVFVKCVQILNLRDANDRWKWLEPIQKPGVPLSKTAILNRAATDTSFLGVVCKFTMRAIKELEPKASMLQAQINFYCLTLVGALNNGEATEAFVLEILPSLLKGMASPVIDFTAAVFMIIAQLVSKTNLNSKRLSVFVDRICSVHHPQMQSDIILLLILIYQKQGTNFNEFPDERLVQFISHAWVTKTLADLAVQSVSISALCTPLVGSCLRSIQTKKEGWRTCKTFLEDLLTVVHFVGDDAKNLIRATLDNYQRFEPPKPKENEIIEIESDDEDVTLDEDVQLWYSEYLQSMEKQYPAEFDCTIKEALQGKQNVSESKKLALKTVLAFRLKLSYSEDNMAIYENLYHHNARNRADAIKYLVKNLGNLKLSQQSEELLKDSFADRLNDDNAEVVNEVLKLSSATFVKMLGNKGFIDKLVDILYRAQSHPGLWKKTISSAITHITSPEVFKNGDQIYIFLALLIYLLPGSDEEVVHVKEILSSRFCGFSIFLRAIAPSVKNATNYKIIAKTVLASMNTVTVFPSADQVLNSIKDVGEKFFLKSTNLSCFMLTIASCYRAGSDPTIGLEILEYIEKYQKKFPLVHIAKEEDWIYAIRENKVPNKLFRSLLHAVAVNSKMSNLDDFNNKSSKSLELFLKVYEILITKACTTVDSDQLNYSSSLQNLLDTILPTPESKLKFLSSFYIADRISAVPISPALQIRSFKVCNLVLTGSRQDFAVERIVFVKILIALTSKVSLIRQCALETLQLLVKCQGLEEILRVLAQHILARSEEILMDEEQFPLVLFTIISPRRDSKSELSMDKEGSLQCLSVLINFVNDETICDGMKAEILQILKHVNSPQILIKLLGLALNILNEAKQAATYSDGEDVICLNKEKSKLLKFIISRFDEETIAIVIDEARAWEILEKTLHYHDILIVSNGKVESVACEVMETFSDSLYEKLPFKFKERFIHLVMEAITFAKHNTLASTANRLIKRIQLDGRHSIPILEKMKLVCTPSGVNRKGPQIKTPDLDALNSAQWKNGITLLELLQNKKKLTNYESLIPILFEILKRCLEYEEQSTLEYAKQLILSCLLHCCQKISSEPPRMYDNEKHPKIAYHTNLVVQCIRATQNPQTHHHALLLLSHLALMIPQQVLTNMMDVFTFMGSSVVRHEDAFSFQIISNIVESVVPTLVKANSGTNPDDQQKLVVPVLKMFADIALDVPEHRRIPLYIKLLRTLGASQYLWMFLCSLFESHVVHDAKERLNRSGKKFSSEEFPKRFEIALHLARDFESEVVLQTCINLFGYLQSLPMRKPEESDKMEVDITDNSLFNVQTHSDTQLRHFKYIILQFISTFTSSAEFVNTIALLNEDETKAMKPYYQNFIIKILSYVPVVNKAMEENSDTSQAKFWKYLLHNCYDILDNAIALLSPDMLLVVVHGLLRHQLPAVRKKVIDMLISKLQYKTDFFGNCNEQNLLELLNPLKKIVDSILGKDKLMENASSAEIMFIQQTALIALKLLSKIMALKHVNEFKEVLGKLTRILKKRNSTSKIILASVVLAVTEISSNLKAHSIAHLSKFMPQLVEILQEQTELLCNQSPDNVCIAFVTGMQKLFETLPLFLGPYIVDVVAVLSLTWVRVLAYQDQEPRTTIVVNKLSSIWNKIAAVMPLRVLIPNCDKTYKKLMEEKHYNAIKFLMKLLTECFGNAAASDVESLQSELTNLFLNALEFRTELVNYENQLEVGSTEEDIMQSFVVYILKLSESSFRPLYQKLYDWAIRDTTSNDRALTYFLLSSKVAESLKSIFVLFASHFLQDAAQLLDNCNTIKSDSLYFHNSEEKNSLMIESILKTLYFIFLHDSKGFINEHRFDILMQPLVDQLENSITLTNESTKQLLVSCLSQLAVVVSNDTLWKQLNYQILLKTRSNNPELRILAFSCCVEIVRKLGESYSPLLPETIPFIAELFEDENERVEKSCRRGVQEMEKILGESLQSYF